MSDRLEFDIPPELSYLRELRRMVRERVCKLGAREERVDRLVLAVDEIVSNSIEHGDDYRVNGHQLHLRLRVRGDDLDVNFFDPDAPASVVDELRASLESSRGQLPDVFEQRGRGFFLMDDSLDEVRIEAGRPAGMRVLGRIVGVFG